MKASSGNPTSGRQPWITDKVSGDQERAVLPKVTQQAGTAEADPTAAQTSGQGEFWQVPEPTPSGLWQEVNKGNISTRSQGLGQTGHMVLGPSS